MPYSGDVNITVLDNQGGVFSGPANSVQAIIGCATGGPINQVLATRTPATLQSTYLGGPMVEAAGLVLTAGGIVLAVRTPSATAGAFNGTTPISGGVTAATAASPIVLTVGSTASLTTGSVVTVAAVGGITAANGTFMVTVINATTFSLDGSTGTGSYTSGGTVTPTGAVATTVGTAAPYFTGTPNDDLYVMAVCQKGFTVGTTGGSMLLSIDGGKNFGPAIPVGTATTLALADAGGMDTGIVLNLGTSGETWIGGGIVNGAPAGDYVRASTTGPQPNDTGIQGAMAAIVAYLAGSDATFPLIQIVGTLAASDATALQSGGSTNLTTLAAQYIYVRAIMSARDAHPPAAWGGAGETEAAWIAAVLLDFSATTAVRVCATAGHYNMTSAFPTSFAGLPACRRPYSMALAARQVAIAPQRHAGKAGGNQGGALAQIIVNPARDPGDGFIYHDEFQTPAFDYFLPGGVGRLASSRTRARQIGRFAADPLTLAPVGSDFSLLPRGIVMDLACTSVHDSLEQFSDADVVTNANGTLSDSAASTIGGAARDGLGSALLAAGSISGYTVVIDQSTNLQITPALKATVSILGVGYVLEEDVTIGFATSLPVAS